MFNPTREQVRAFFFEAWRKHRERLPLEPLEAIAADIVAAHPEYHAVLDDPARYAARDWTPEDGATNPFLHLAMHLAIEEQLSIDQPPGVRAAFARLAARRGDRLAAQHDAMECLGEMLWTAQRTGTAPDGAAYVECLDRQARR